MEYTKHLYQILYPNHALVASHLDCLQFAKHYQVGSTRFYQGKLIFAEVDPSFRSPAFDVEAGLKALVPHEDGSPKQTKFIATYRVLEHMNFEAIRSLHIATPEGYCYSLKPEPYVAKQQDYDLHIYAEICPVSMLILTSMETPEFSKHITDPLNPKSAPKMFFTSLILPVDEFLGEFEQNPFLPPPFPFLHPSKLRDAIVEIREKGNDKRVKGLTLYSQLEHISFRSIRRGFWFVSYTDTLFFPMPALKQIEAENLRFYNTM